MRAKQARRKRRAKMRHRTKLRSQMGLDELTRGSTQLKQLTKEEKSKAARDSERRMIRDRRRREARRLRSMNEYEDLEDKGVIIHPLRPKGEM